ncbi:ComEC/Rec2 family competence protein [Corynebacterium aquatimens]|uniref:ComEC/Rec2 family competence protein n=1 Tax=Corynebacterium aquatimens TaxID=1190508 RepID=UPI003313EA08
MFSTSLDDGIVPGAHVTCTGRLGESSMPGVNPYVLSGEVVLNAPPTGYAAFAQHVRETFGAAVAHHVGPASTGLIPGMVLGDTTAQSAAEQQMYIDTGLSHLSAVSGSNVAIVTTAAVVAATLLRLGLRVRLLSAAVALLGFAGLVGPEPSVLRASVMGLVGLVAVCSSTRSEPIHALCLATIGLLLVDTDLAAHYGFALSVAATVGIVAISPLIHRALAMTGWPDIVNRALAVAIAADVVTMPIVALMSGQVSLVSVAANVLVAPVTAPVTVLGLAAAAASLVPGGLETPLLTVIEPMTWWVHEVALRGSALPLATIAATPVVVMVAYGWVLAGIVGKRPRLTAAATATAIAFASLRTPPPPPAPAYAEGLTVHVVATKADVEPVPPGTELVVVLEQGRPPRRPVRTQGGIDVIFPNRAGP